MPSRFREENTTKNMRTHHRKRTKSINCASKSFGANRSLATSLQPSYYHGNQLIYRGIKQVCGLFNLFSRASTKFNRAARNRLITIKKLEGVYNTMDTEASGSNLEVGLKANEQATKMILSLVSSSDQGCITVFDTIFKKYNGPDGQLSRENLSDLFRNVQRMCDEDIVEIQKQFNDCETVSWESVVKILLEDENQKEHKHSAVDENQTNDMTRPLTHYWINSSHNTYLSGRQMGAKAANYNQYKQVLESGCRCIELDVYEVYGELQVCHRSLTNCLDFDLVLKTIKEYAFTTSRYPLILSIEKHLTEKSVGKMMQSIKHFFKGHLLEDRLDNQSRKLNLSSLSPEKLRRCVLIKMKKTEGFHGDFSVAKLKLLKKRMSEGQGYFDADTVKKSELTANEIISLPESTARLMINVNATESRSCTSSNLTRIYPSSLRVDSSNFSPMEFWVAGCQMVALNHQKPGSSILYNSALFKLNKKRGYILKPEAILSGGIPTYPVEKLFIQILSGHRFIHFPRGVDLGKQPKGSLKVSVHGVEQDNKVVKSQNSFILGSDFLINASFKFELCLPEAAFLKITLLSSVQMGSFVAKVDTLQSGLRFLHLTDLAGQKASPSSCLFVHIERRALENEQ